MPEPRSRYSLSLEGSFAVSTVWRPPMLIDPDHSLFWPPFSAGACANAGVANRPATRIASGVRFIVVPYLKKSLPRTAGALLPCRLLWQLTQPRAISRVFLVPVQLPLAS